STVLSGTVMGGVLTCPAGGVEAFLPAARRPCNDADICSKGINDMKLKDQVAIVTGAGRNIGEEVARLFAQEGAKIAGVDMDKAGGQGTVDTIKAKGGDAELYVTDVSKGADVAAMVKAVVGRFGHVDILVNNVAVSDNKTIFECTEEDWDRVMTVTLKSQFLMSKHVAEQMRAQGGGGKIVNVGSTSGWQGR